MISFEGNGWILPDSRRFGQQYWAPSTSFWLKIECLDSRVLKFFCNLQRFPIPSTCRSFWSSIHTEIQLFNFFLNLSLAQWNSCKTGNNCTGCRNRELILIEGDTGVDLLLPLLLFRILTESAFRTVGDVQRMVTSWVCQVVTCAKSQETRWLGLGLRRCCHLWLTSFDDEGVRLAFFDVDFGDQQIVDVPGNAPRWLTCEPNEKQI